MPPQVLSLAAELPYPSPPSHSQNEADPGAKVVSATLYDGYQRWAKANGYSPLSAGKFGGEVKRAFPKMRRGQEERIWHYFGVRFNQVGD